MRFKLNFKNGKDEACFKLNFKNDKDAERRAVNGRDFQRKRIVFGA